MKNICVISGSRAEYGLLVPLLKKVKQSKCLHLQLIVTTMHMSESYGNTHKDIIADGFKIDECIENILDADTHTGTVKSAALCMLFLADTYKRLRPDYVLLLGDRYETHAAATAASLMRIPIVHLHGGELSYGSTDEHLRHSITKLSHLHFTSTSSYRQRVIQMGEDPANVIVSGALGIDNINAMTLLSREQIEKSLNWKLGATNVLFTFHPDTMNFNTEENMEMFDVILNQIDAIKRDVSVIFTYANADPGGSHINTKIESFVKLNRSKYKVVKNLGSQKYLSLMSIVDLVMGNSSSGIIEAASFKKPVINIGDRQAGRLRNENVIDCEYTKLNAAIEKALSISFVKKCDNVVNLYGQGHASDIILELLENRKIQRLKRFNDIL